MMRCRLGTCLIPQLASRRYAALTDTPLHSKLTSKATTLCMKSLHTGDTRNDRESKQNCHMRHPKSTVHSALLINSITASRTLIPAHVPLTLVAGS